MLDALGQQLDDKAINPIVYQGGGVTHLKGTLGI
jgi:hypothetical protein